MQFRVIVVTDPQTNTATNTHTNTSHTHKPTDRTDYNTLHRSFASVQCKKPRLRERTDRAWFGRLLWHPAKKWSGVYSFNLEPARGMCTVYQYAHQVECFYVQEAPWPNGLVGHSPACMACTVCAEVVLWLSEVAEEHQLASCEWKVLHTIQKKPSS